MSKIDNTVHVFVIIYLSEILSDIRSDEPTNEPTNKANHIPQSTIKQPNNSINSTLFFTVMLFIKSVKSSLLSFQSKSLNLLHPGFCSHGYYLLFFISHYLPVCL